MMRRVLGFGALLVLVAVGAWLVLAPAASPRQVSEAEARAYFHEIVAASQARDFTKLCNLNGAVLNCRRVLDNKARAAVPTAAPTVIMARYVGKRESDESEGWLLTVSGSDGRGQPYTSEVFIFRDDKDALKAINAVFWLGDRIGLGDPNGTATPG